MHIACQHAHRRIRRCGEDRKPHRGCLAHAQKAAPLPVLSQVGGGSACRRSPVSQSQRQKQVSNKHTDTVQPQDTVSPVSHAHPHRTQTIRLQAQSAEEAGSKCTFAGRRWGRHTPHKNKVKPARQLRKGRPAAGRAANGPVTNSWRVTGRWCQT